MAASALIATPAARAAERTDGRLTDLVNPFIGSQNEEHTPSPARPCPSAWCSLARHRAQHRLRLHPPPHSRLLPWSTSRAWAAASAGTCPCCPPPATSPGRTTPGTRRRFSHDDEEASPGYYRVGLASGIRAELTATARTGVQRYTFPATGKANVLLNAAQSLHKPVRSAVRILDDRTVRTEITGRGFCRGTGPLTVYTITRFSRPFTAYGTWDGGTVTPGARTGSGGAYVRFDTTRDRTVEATTALSYVDARRGSETCAPRADGPSTPYATVPATSGSAGSPPSGCGAAPPRSAAPSTPRCTGRTSHPTSAVTPTARYFGWDRRTHRARGFTYYQNWSLWDTYRTQAQLLALLAPARGTGHGPVGRRGRRGRRVAAQVGLRPGRDERRERRPRHPVPDHRLPDGAAEGLRGAGLPGAAGRTPIGVPPAAYPGIGREANAEYIANGFAPYIKGRPHAKMGDSDYHHGASVTLEYALADAMLAQMARGLGHHEDAARYAARSRNYRNIFDPATGFFRARDDSGAFTGSPDPARGTGFHEGTAWQYQWLVPQDVPGHGRPDRRHPRGQRPPGRLLRLRPAARRPGADRPRGVGARRPVRVLQRRRVQPDERAPTSSPPTPTCSPASPGRPRTWCAPPLTLFTDSPTGMTGNDDLGTMSAWHVLSSIGLFPVQPGYDTWGLTAPVFERVDLHLDRRYWPGGRLTVTAPGTSSDDRYVQAVHTDGTAQGRRI
ncbi:glycoside hydrolase family 92 protein [Streptomyces tricolor]|nr:glycoside hydrolase family 92 protein [Streptomyces tricolor]